jgi:hypothetical protein
MTDYSRLVMTRGPQPGQTFVLDQEQITLGRDPGNDIVINDPQVSRQHARITRQGNLMVIEDAGSTNGTFVDGVRLSGAHTLTNSDVIGLGDVVTLTHYGHGADIPATESLAGQPTAQAMPPSYEPVLELAQPPVYTPPPPPAYAAGPVPVPATSPAEEDKSKIRLWIGCGCAALLLVCIGVSVFLWYAPATFWQALIDLGIPVPTWPF